LAVDGSGLSEQHRISGVVEQICSQKDHPGSSKIPREIQKGRLNSLYVLLLYEVFAVLLRYIRKHVFPFVFHHCDIIQLGCFDSIALFLITF